MKQNDRRGWRQRLGILMLAGAATAPLTSAAQTPETSANKTTNTTTNTQQSAAQNAQRGVLQSVPQSWIDYGRRVGQEFEASLEGDSATSNELHAFLEERIANAKADAPPPALLIRAWIGSDGAITSVQFDTMGDAKADAQLRELLMTRSMAGAPPADMRQPLRVRLRLKPAEAKESTNPAESTKSTKPTEPIKATEPPKPTAPTSALREAG